MNILKEIKRICLSEKAYRLVVKEKYTEALEIYNEICKLNDNIPEIYSNKFAILIKLHNFESALDCIDKLIQLEPDDANVFYQKACLLSLKELQRHEEAIKYYDIAINKKNLSDVYLSDAYLGKGVSLACIHKYKEAEECYEAAEKIDRNNHWIFSNKAIVVFKQNRLDEALKLCDLAIKYKSKQKFNLGFAYFIKSRIFALKDSKEECIEALSKAISIDISVKNKICDCEEFNNIKDDPYFKNIVD